MIDAPRWTRKDRAGRRKIRRVARRLMKIAGPGKPDWRLMADGNIAPENIAHYGTVVLAVLGGEESPHRDRLVREIEHAWLEAVRGGAGGGRPYFGRPYPGHFGRPYREQTLRA